MSGNSFPEPEDEEEDDAQDPAEVHSEQDSARAEIAHLLLRAGADADAREPKGHQRPMHLAAMNGYAKTIKVLLR